MSDPTITIKASSWARVTQERDKARDWVFRLRKHRAIARNFGYQMERERDHWKRECLEQAKLLAMGADREEKLRDALKYVAGLDTSQDASPQQCNAVLVAIEALQ